MMKKIVWVLFVILTTAAMILASCAPQQAAPTAAPAEAEEPAEAPAQVEEVQEPVKLTLTMWGSQLDVDTYTKRVEMAKEKYPNISVEVIYIPTDYAQKLQTMIAGGTGPDIMELAEDATTYASKGQIIPLDEFINQSGTDIKSRFAPGMIDWFTYEGKLYAMPDRSGAMILYYNKDMFDKAGVAYPSKSWTWNDFLTAAQALTIRDGDEVTQYGFANISWWPYWMSFMWANGGGIFDETGMPAVNTPENIDAVQFYNDLVWKHQVSPTPEEYANMGNPGPDQLFAQKKLAMELTGFWNLQSLKDVPDLNWDIAPMWQQKQGATPAFGNGLAISKDSKHPEEAYKVLEFLSSVEGQMPIIENFEDAPANLEAQASDAFLKPTFTDKPISMSAFKDSADMIFIPFHPRWNEMMKVFDDNLSEVWLNQKDVKTALDTIQADLEALFQE
jgi:multiple sugar transport system substrate-binding protein